VAFALAVEVTVGVAVSGDRRRRLSRVPCSASESRRPRDSTEVAQQGRVSVVLCAERSSMEGSSDSLGLRDIEVRDDDPTARVRRAKVYRPLGPPPLVRPLLAAERASSPLKVAGVDARATRSALVMWIMRARGRVR